MNINWLKRHKKCENLVKIHEDVNERNDLSQLDIIFSKTCNAIPYGVCCRIDIVPEDEAQKSKQPETQVTFGPENKSKQPETQFPFGPENKSKQPETQVTFVP